MTIITRICGFLLVCAGAISEAPAQTYTPDYIDIERWEDRKALKSHNCTWLGRDCHWRHRWHHRGEFVYRPRIQNPNPEIMAAQIRLRDLGYYREDIDGLMGPDTREALEAFQWTHDLDATGKLDDTTWRVLRKAERRSKGERDDGDRDGGRDCKGWEYGIGKETYSPGTAQESAQANWIERVKFKYGVRYADPSYAASDARFMCARSGAGQRKSEKFVAAIPFGIGKKLAGGDYLQQCEVIARPCAVDETPVADPERVDIVPDERKKRD